MNSLKFTIVPFILLFICFSCNKDQSDLDIDDHRGWEVYAGTKTGIRYSSNNQINLSNVKELEEAWRFSSEDRDSLNRSQNQCNPIVVDGILYGTSPKLKLLALDAATGVPKWIFDPATLDTSLEDDPYRFYKVNRGVVYWEDKEGNNKRLFYNVGSQVFAIDADKGVVISDFGDEGTIDLSKDLDRDPSTFNPFVANTSPGIIYKNLLILGSRVAESADAAPGHIRAYDVLTGERRWIFHTIPHPGEIGYDTWPDKEAYKKLGGANSWAGMALDEERGIVYVPTGSISGDFYGGIREGQNLFANSLIALDAATGTYKWHFQTVHHDLWDRDLPANPNLVTLYKDGDEIDAVAQISKQGYIFLFNRDNGEPIFPIEEVAVPQSGLPGEKLWPTQPIPSLPEPFARQSFTEDEVNDLSKETHKIMLKRYRQIKFKESFHPPSKEGNWIFPGFDGGGEWGGAAIDPETQILYINSSELPWAMVMVDVAKADASSGESSGRQVYNKYCFACHGLDLKGNGTSYPTLINMKEKYKQQELLDILNNGMNMMPPFNHISEEDKNAVVDFLLNFDEELGKETMHSKEPMTSKEPMSSKEPISMESDSSSILDLVPYQMAGYNRFLDDEGYPGIKPPWGTLNAVDLNTGNLLWKVPLGEYQELTAQGHPITGTENYGGPVVTKGGLVFIAATKDSKIRAFNKENGELVWDADLPVPAYATPSIYSIDGKQYLVIACGGGKIGSKSGDEYIAFALPD